MRIFPFLSKVPKYKRFNIEPRHYDPAKEELDQRKERIRREVESERRRAAGLDPNVAGQEPGAYLRANSIRSHRSVAQERSQQDRTANFTRLGIITVLVGGGMGWLYFGTDALIPVALVACAFLYFRIRKG